MNILIVSNYYPKPNKPHCIFIHQQARALAMLGHQVEVIVPTVTFQLGAKPRMKKLDEITVSYFPYFNLYKRIFSHLVLQGNITKLENYLDFDRYDVISVHMFDEYVLRIFTEISKRHPVKLLLHYHGLSVSYDYHLPLRVKLLQHRGDFILKKLVAKSDAIVGVSEKVCERVRSYHQHKQVYTVYNGVDTQIFQPDLQTVRRTFKIITVAGLKKLKGNHYLIDAVKMLTDKHPTLPVKLIIIGRGPENEALRAQVKALGMDNIVHMIGYIRYEEVAILMQKCSVFAMPSYYEALGCAYLEAMACRLPVIGCRRQGIDEILEDGVNGCLIEPHNVLQLFEKLEYLLMNPEKAKEIAQLGYQTVMNGYTWLDSAKRLSEVYYKVCKKP